MSVPPPSCTPNSTSTGSASSSVRSTIAVSNTTSLVVDRRDRRHDGGEDRGIDHRGRHRARLVDAQDDLVEIGARRRLAAVADQALRDDGAVLRLPVPQVGADRARPVDVGEARPARALGAWLTRAADRLGGLAARASPSARRRPCATTMARGVLASSPAWRRAGDEIGDEMHVRLQRRQEFRLEQHLLQAEALEGVLLDHLHDRRREELADVAEPARDARRRCAEAAAALAAALRRPPRHRARPERRSRRRSRSRQARRHRRRRAPAASGVSARLCVMLPRHSSLEPQDREQQRQRRREGRRSADRRWRRARRRSRQPRRRSACSSRRRRSIASKLEKARRSIGRRSMKSLFAERGEPAIDDARAARHRAAGLGAACRGSRRASAPAAFGGAAGESARERSRRSPPASQRVPVVQPAHREARAAAERRRHRRASAARAARQSAPRCGIVDQVERARRSASIACAWPRRLSRRDCGRHDEPGAHLDSQAVTRGVSASRRHLARGAVAQDRLTSGGTARIRPAMSLD